MKELITKEGYIKLEKELKFLIEVRRIEIADSLRYATELGDLRENAEYDAALMDYEEIESKIYKLEKTINNCIIKENSNNDFINIGSKVRIKYDDGEIEEVTLVGPSEIDPLDNKISYLSPLGSAIFNKSIGDNLKISTETFNYSVKIIDIL